MTLVQFDPKNEGSVLTLLEVAATWLAEAVHRGEPEEIAAVKAQMATAAEATKQLNLSKEIQLDAQEMVRRAEYALGKAIRRGQEDGTVRKYGEHQGPTAAYTRVRLGQEEHIQPAVREANSKLSPREVFSHGQEWVDTLTIADGATPERFEEVLAEAKTEGNLSRANVVRKVKHQAGPVSRDQRADLIEELAAQGYSSRQMPAKVGVTEETVRRIARDFDIDIPADRSIRKTRRLDSTRVVVNTATALEGLVSGIDLIDYDDVDPAQAGQWVDSLNDSLKKLARFVKQIKETTQ